MVIFKRITPIISRQRRGDYNPHMPLATQQATKNKRGENMNKVKSETGTRATATAGYVCGCGREGRYVKIVDGKEEHACNKYGKCPSYEDLGKRIAELTDALKKYREAMEFTRQYVGYKTLPEIDGWSWFDADQNAKRILGLNA